METQEYRQNSEIRYQIQAYAFELTFVYIEFDGLTRRNELSWLELVLFCPSVYLHNVYIDRFIK